MIDRTYLPYESARKYMDRGMVKWMGFFLSEHTSALTQVGDRVYFTDKFSKEEKSLLLTQVFLNRSRIFLAVRDKKIPYLGQIYDINKEEILLKTEDKIVKIEVLEIVEITLAEGE